MTFLMMVTNIVFYADNTIVYSLCCQVSNFCQQLELASELESDLPDTVD